MKLSFVLMLIVPFLWSLNFVFGKVLITTLPPFTISAGRFTVAGLLFVIWIVATRKRLPAFDVSLFLNLLALSFTGVVTFNGLLYISLRYTTVINATIINSFTPISTIILAAVILKERIGWHEIAGAVLSIFGVYLIMSSGNPGVFNGFNTGDIIVFLDTFIWAMFSVMGKRLMTLFSPLETSAFSTLIGLPFLWLASFIEANAYNLVSIPWSAVYMLIFLGVFASFLSFIWWYRGINDFGTSRAATFYNLIPLYALLINWFFLEEEIFSFQIIGGLLIIGGILMSSLRTISRFVSTKDQYNSSN